MLSDTAWWRRGDAAGVQPRRPSVQLGGQASRDRGAVARSLRSGWVQTGLVIQPLSDCGPETKLYWDVSGLEDLSADYFLFA